MTFFKKISRAEIEITVWFMTYSEVRDNTTIDLWNKTIHDLWREIENKSGVLPNDFF